MKKIVWSLMFLVSLASISRASDNQAKPGRKSPTAPAKTPGIKTPGVQIPFAKLKTEAEIKPVKPDWIFFSAAVYAPAENGIQKIDAKTNKLGDPISGIKQPCGGMASAFKSLWAPDCGSASLARIDAKTFKVTNTIASGVSTARGIVAATADSIWLLTDDKSTLVRVDPDQNQVVAELRVPAGCRSLTFAETALWLACPKENKVLRINPATNLVDNVIEVSAAPVAINAGAGSIWVLCRKDGKIDRIDPKTNKVTKTIELEVPDAEGDLAYGEGYLWVTQTGFPLTRIDTKSETVIQQFAGTGGGAIALSTGAIWLSNFKEGTLSRIDPKRVFATLPD
jgi:DNA-binding beta-propeller fold protein YncE